MSEGCLHMHNCFISTDLIIHLSLLPSIETLSSSLSLSLSPFLPLPVPSPTCLSFADATFTSVADEICAELSSSSCIDFPGFDTDICKYMTPSCPISAGKTYNVTIPIYIQKFFPSVSFLATGGYAEHWERMRKSNKPNLITGPFLLPDYCCTYLIADECHSVCDNNYPCVRTSVTAFVTNNYLACGQSVTASVTIITLACGRVSQHLWQINTLRADGCDRKHTFQLRAFSYFSSSQLTVILRLHYRNPEW